MGRSLGKGMREFKTAITSDSDNDDKPELPALDAAGDRRRVAAPREHDTV